MQESTVVGTYANRLIHQESVQCIIGPHIIDTHGNVRTFEDLVDIRLTGTARHLSCPRDMVYFLGMEGEFHEANVHTLETRLIGELTDDLWQWGKPAGWGGPWWDTPVKGGEPSDPYLMAGFEHECLHISAEGEGTTVHMEIDFRGDGRFYRYGSLDVADDGYVSHVFQTGFSAHWIRLVPDGDATLTAQFVYT